MENRLDVYGRRRQTLNKVTCTDDDEYAYVSNSTITDNVIEKQENPTVAREDALWGYTVLVAV